MNIDNLKDYLRSISKEDRHLIVSYLSKSKKLNREKNYSNIEKTILDIRKVNEYLKKGNDTSLVTSRLSKEINIIDLINQFLITKDESLLEEIAYSLDLLYEECNLPPRGTTAIEDRIMQRR